MDVVLPARPPARPGRRLPAWPAVLAVVAHPDDESFGLGAVIAMLAAASQISPAAVLWRRLQLQGEREHLRWLIPPRATAAPPALKR